MAEMIPESMNASKEATPGEHVFRCLRDALLPDEDYIVWYEPKSAKRRPDFLVWSQDMGLLVIEVKDWTASSIVKVDPERWTLRHDHVDITHQSPIEQARESFILFSWCDIAVLYAAAQFVGNFSTAFSKRFGKEKVSWMSRSRGSKINLDLSSPMAKLCTIESAKGLEFRLVLLVGLEMLPRPERKEADERKLACVGLTRAQDLLYILGSDKSGLLKELSEIVDVDTM